MPKSKQQVEDEDNARRHGYKTGQQTHEDVLAREKFQDVSPLVKASKAAAEKRKKREEEEKKAKKKVSNRGSSTPPFFTA